MKIELEGWVAKNFIEELRELAHQTKGDILFKQNTYYLSDRRGKEGEPWYEDEYPPIKISLIVEEL